MDARLEPGLRLYAIGDVHGCLDLLEDLLARILADLADWAGRTRLVFLGDYVDRGEASAAVVERLAGGPAALGLPEGSELVVLKGNHEEFLLRSLEEEEALPTWLANGGDATCASYGLDPRSLLRGLRPLAGLRLALRRALPAAHRSFLERLPLSHQAGDYFFCHAGVRPGVPLARQEPHDLLWIREPFLSARDDFGKVVVHGHTPTARPQLQDNRIGIDTGAVYGGRLTAVSLEGGERRFLHV